MTPTQKYLMFISYIGSGFRGSQFLSASNPALETVQSAVESGLKFVFKLEGERPIQILLASRTDADVHSLKSATTVRLPIFKNDFIKPNTLAALLNEYFLKNSKNIWVVEAKLVPDSFCFKTAVISKTYMYRLGIIKEEYFKASTKIIFPIIESKRTHFIGSKKEFDLNKAQEAAHLFEGEKDYGAVLGRPSRNTRPTVCNIMSFELQESQPFFPLDPLNQRFNFYQFSCTGNRFLYHMMRRMVALALGVGFGKINLKDIQKLFDEPVPSSWPIGGFMMPGYGLYLIDTHIDPSKLIQSQELCDKINDVNLKTSQENAI